MAGKRAVELQGGLRISSRVISGFCRAAVHLLPVLGGHNERLAPGTAMMRGPMSPVRVAVASSFLTMPSETRKRWAISSRVPSSAS